MERKATYQTPPPLFSCSFPSFLGGRLPSPPLAKGSTEGKEDRKHPKDRNPKKNNNLILKCKIANWKGRKKA